METGDWIAFIALIASVVIPMLTVMLRLNSTITKLVCSMEREHTDGEKREHRLDSHSQKLDEHERKITEHEVRLDHLETRTNQGP